MTKLAIVVSHPIQHFCPQYASFAKLPGIDLKVFFGSRLGVESYSDANFSQTIKWENLYLEEFNHTFLNNKVLPADKFLDSDVLAIELEKFNPNYIIIYGYSQKLQKKAYKWAIRSKIPIFYVADSELSQKRLFGITTLKSIFLNGYFKRIAGFLTVGDANEDYYAYYGVPLTKMHRCFFSIDIRSYRNAVSAKEILISGLRSLHGLNDNDFIISTVGKLISIKRQEDVIKALVSLNLYRAKRIVYFVIGSGPDMEKLKQTAREVEYHKVIFTGFTKPEDLPAYYLASDIYIHPSEIEPHSLAVSEAIYCGCPVILSDRCGSYGPTDDVQKGYNGFVYDCGDTAQLAKYIELLLVNDELRQRFSENSSVLGVKHQSLAHGEGLMKAINASKYAK